MRVLKKTNFREARDALLAETGITGVEKVGFQIYFKGAATGGTFLVI